jgi:tetratricopeptide (TPR) repeat protein
MKQFFCFLTGAIILFSCGTPGDKTTIDGSVSNKDQGKRDSMLLKIHAIETTINTNMKAAILDPHLASEAVQYYTQFASVFPQDSNSAMFLFRASDIECNAMHLYDQALAHLQQITEKHPEFRKLPVVYFQIGVIYDDNLNDDVKAKVAYEKFLEKFPDHPLASQVKALIGYLGKTNEELLKEFEKKNK